MQDGTQTERALITRTNIGAGSTPHAMAWAKTYDFTASYERNYRVEALAIEPDGSQAIAILQDYETPDIGSSDLIIMQIDTIYGGLIFDTAVLVMHND